MQDDDETDDQNIDDAELFARHMQDVTPLKSDNRVNERRPSSRPRVKRHHDATVDEERFAGYDFSAADYDDIPEILSFSRPGIQHSKLAKLRQGKLQVQESIDLHGSTVQQAREYLFGFLTECRQQQLTVVRIVHGKGTRSKGKLPVIKANLNLWLREAPEVLAFHSAPKHDGGTGALYVLLKRY